VNIDILTLFPAISQAYFSSSIMARAAERGFVEYRITDIRDFALDKHRTCDDAPYGGGAGMVLKPEPLAGALDACDAGTKRVVYPSPSGRPFTQEYAHELAAEEDLVFICGRYEGIDQRIIDLYVDDELCIGDYVMSSGELAALVIIDTVYRLLEGVITDDSLKEESFRDGLLEYPHYTRPMSFRGLPVPDILLSGHHAEIDRWRHKKRVEKTRENRPDLCSWKSETESDRHT
jgi:tRNA (guanine37-N1)-methyltransferase